MRARRYVVILASVLIALLWAPVRARAAPGVSISMSSDPTIHLDSNKPCVQGFKSAYVAFRITNTSGAALTRVNVTLSGFANGFILEGGQAAAQYIGGMQPGATETMYWYVTGPCTFNQSANLIVSVTDATSGSTTGSGTIQTKQSISANAGGNIVGSTLGIGAIVGQTIYMDAQYSFGGVQAGDTYSFQPAGNTTFNAACFQMTGSQIMTSGANAVPAGTIDTEFFRAASSQSGNGHEVVVRWYFRYLCENTSTTSKPYATQQSGSTNLKYSGNYDAYVGPTLPGATNPYVVTMTVTPTVLATGGVVTYTLTVHNPSILTGTLDYVGVQLPVGVTFNALAAGGNVTTANSAEYPAAGATGLLIWRGSPTQSYIVPGGTSLVLRFTATVTSTPGSYTAMGSGVAGLTLLGVAQATVTVTGAPSMLLSRSVSTGTPGPGTDVTHTIQVENAGNASAHQVLLSDVIATQYAFKLNSIGVTLPAGLTVTATYTSDGSTWTYTPVSGACGAPAGYDACVRGIRWSVNQPLANGVTAGTFVYVAQVR